MRGERKENSTVFKLPCTPCICISISILRYGEISGKGLGTLFALIVVRDVKMHSILQLQGHCIRSHTALGCKCAVSRATQTTDCAQESNTAR